MKINVLSLPRRMSRPSFGSLLGVALLAALLGSVPASAGTIAGSAGPDVLRGTAKADSIYGKAGNDKLYGLAGNDVLNGGPGRDLLEGGAGNDRLVARDGIRDVLRCGLGRDTAIADAADAVRGDCELVFRPTVAPPPPPGSSRDNPVPFGQSALAANGWRITVTGVYPDATAAILAANMFNDPPAAGSQFFMIAVTATYTGAGSSHLDSGFGMRAVGASSVVFTTFQNSCGVLPQPNLKLDDPEVFSGGTVSGNAACWQIPASDAGSLVMFYEAFLSDQRIWFALR